MSREYPRLLKKRALNALKWAEIAFMEGDYDTALREAGYAVQLYTKSLIFRLLGEEIGEHDIRGLLGILAFALLEKELGEHTSLVIDYVRWHKRVSRANRCAHESDVWALRIW